MLSPETSRFRFPRRQPGRKAQSANTGDGNFPLYGEIVKGKDVPVAGFSTFGQPGSAVMGE